MNFSQKRVGKSILNRTLIIVSCALLSITSYADTDTVNENHAEMHVVWDKIPIAFVLPVGQERIISFPGKVIFEGAKANAILKSETLSVLNNEGTLYITANKPFSPVRVPIELVDTGQTVLLDISAKPNANDTPMNVLIKEHSKIENSHEDTGSHSTYNIPTLIRYVAQRTCSECGPKSAEENLPGIIRAPMFSSKFVDLFQRKYNVVGMPLGSWQQGSYYVTAVRIKNTSKSDITLLPSDVLGNWTAVTFLPSKHLDASGQLNDRITVILVSTEPFNQAFTGSRGYFHG